MDHSQATSAAPNEAPTSAVAPGRRERNKQDKQSRIHTAAAALFTERGYSAVTTQDIADRADVAIGTLFRYASSKAELLLMVFNDDWRRSLEHEPAAAGSDPRTRIMALLGPLVTAGARHRENTAVYQREILFGEPGPYRSEALTLVDQLEEAIGTALLSFDGTMPGVERLRPGTDASLAARTVFSVLHMELIRASIGRSTATDLPRVLSAEIDVVLHGLLQPPVPQ
ncbi:TetR/AcrR family transcriptional regulator [Cryobacterium cryoconiti]|uniref:TetR/AcrR family transcriptional regulator n=1 Tax=Cryobacterium cryoconiti TaxID=1259239 RepID=A0A4Y8JXS6_9MICO|nr:TetR/AcrR family transcriptional regulator [Cryobacterium cryoconiti]TFD29050.1 TetR/AcrR family transcriptional regulator [Cryobacterium cryoconiti]